MRLKQDKFILRALPEYEDSIYPEILSRIPEEFRQMFALLWTSFQSLTSILDSSNHESAMSILCANNIDIEKTPFTGIYRDQYCLQHILRKEFFETLLICENVYSELGTVLFRVLEKEQKVTFKVISEKDIELNRLISTEIEETLIETHVEDLISENRWNSEMPTDQKYRVRPIENLNEELIEPIS